MAMPFILYAITACDTEEEFLRNSANLDGRTPFHRGLGGMPEVKGRVANAPLTLLPQDAGDELYERSD